MNRIILVGRLTKDPEKKIIEEKGKTFTKFTIAVDRGFKNSSGEREADFIPIVLWGKKAEIAGDYLKKGTLISVCGRLSIRSYEDESGNKRYISEVICDSFQFIEHKRTSESDIAAN